jgi:hypothetical protein
MSDEFFPCVRSGITAFASSRLTIGTTDNKLLNASRSAAPDSATSVVVTTAGALTILNSTTDATPRSPTAIVSGGIVASELNVPAWLRALPLEGEE